jgi:DNA-binding response OmpR family regulator
MRAALRILLIEGDPLLQQTLASALEDRCQGEVRTAPDVERGLEMALEYKPDLILLDLGVPGLDGLNTCQAIANHRDLTRTKLWVMTGVILDDETRSAMACYADRMIQMPLSATALSAEICEEIQSSGPPLQWLGE